MPAASSLEFLFRVLPGSAPGPRLSISLSAREDGKEAFHARSLSLAAGLTRYVLQPPAGSQIRSVALSLESQARSAAEQGAAGAGPPGSDGELFRLEEIRLVAAFAGLERLEGGVRISEGSALYLAGGLERCVIEAPFARLLPTQEGVPVLLLDYPPSRRAFSVSLIVDGKPFLGLRGRKEGGRLVLPRSLFPALVQSLEVRAPSIIACRSLILPRREAEAMDLGLLLRLPPGEADYQLHRWDLQPSVLVFDFRDYATQDRYLKRLAFFVEKLGYKGRLASDTEIEGLHGWNAHDYRPEDLAAFFGKALAEAFPLRNEELALRDLLLERGVIRSEGRGYAAGEGAIISIARETDPSLRSTFLAHESLHALYFVDPGWRSLVAADWKAVPEPEKWFWKLYLGWAAYDTANDYLMANEYMAYLLQRQLRFVTEYFTKNLPSRVLENHAELAPRIEAYMSQYGTSFEARARALGERLEEGWGLRPGVPGLLD
jgi:hypothetical protein